MPGVQLSSSMPPLELAPQNAAQAPLRMPNPHPLTLSASGLYQFTPNAFNDLVENIARQTLVYAGAGNNLSDSQRPRMDNSNNVSSRVGGSQSYAPPAAPRASASVDPDSSAFPPSVPLSAQPILAHLQAWSESAFEDSGVLRLLVPHGDAFINKAGQSIMTRPDFGVFTDTQRRQYAQQVVLSVWRRLANGIYQGRYDNLAQTLLNSQFSQQECIAFYTRVLSEYGVAADYGAFFERAMSKMGLAQRALEELFRLRAANIRLQMAASQHIVEQRPFADLSPAVLLPDTHPALILSNSLRPRFACPRISRVCRCTACFRFERTACTTAFSVRWRRSSVSATCSALWRSSL